MKEQPMETSADSPLSAYKNFWVVAETSDGRVESVTYELLGAARALADARGAELWCVALGEGSADDREAMIRGGADAVVAVDDQRLSDFVEEDRAKVLLRLIRKYKPEAVLCGATNRGRALIPRVAVMAGSGLTADCTGLAIDPDNGDLLQTRPAFGGNVMATIRCAERRPQFATVRPRVMAALAPDATRVGRLIREELAEVDILSLKRVIETYRDPGNAVSLADARFIIAGGRSMKGPEGFALLRRLAERVGGAVGASRAAVDSGWIPYSQQVGQTGLTVQAKVYVACGISGQIQHLVGMQSCDCIVAIDRNPDTPMMRLADIAVVGDLFEIVPRLIEELQAT